MACSSTQTPTELEFVQALVRRQRAVAECRGPLLRIGFEPYRVFVLENIMDSQPASDLLWDGLCRFGHTGLYFEMCGAHWMDMAILCEIRSIEYHRADFETVSKQLLLDVCQVAGWDPKEILNMIVWQRERLT